MTESGGMVWFDDKAKTATSASGEKAIADSSGGFLAYALGRIGHAAEVHGERGIEPGRRGGGENQVCRHGGREHRDTRCVVEGETPFPKYGGIRD